MSSFTLGRAGHLSAHLLRVLLQGVNLLFLVEHCVGSEDLAGQQQTCQGGQACNFQSPAVGATETQRDKCHLMRMMLWRSCDNRGGGG